MDKFLLFTSGVISETPANTNYDSMGVYNSNNLQQIKPNGIDTLSLIFSSEHGTSYVDLKIKRGTHSVVTQSIVSAIKTSKESMLTIADIDNNSFANPNIRGVVIHSTSPIIAYVKIINATQVNVIPINTKLERLKSMTISNIHSGDATVQVFLSNATDNWYILKDVSIPVGSTLKLEGDELDYDGSVFNLYVKLSSATPVDIIVR